RKRSDFRRSFFFTARRSSRSTNTGRKENNSSSFRQHESRHNASRKCRTTNPRINMEKIKKANESLTIMTNIVLPNETNSLRNLFGGELLAKMDRCASISAARHCARRVVTASVNHVSFNQPIPEGGIVVLESKVSRAFSTSMEIYVDVWLDDPIAGKKI